MDAMPVAEAMHHAPCVASEISLPFARHFSGGWLLLGTMALAPEDAVAHSGNAGAAWLEREKRDFALMAQRLCILTLCAQYSRYIHLGIQKWCYERVRHETPPTGPFDRPPELCVGFVSEGDFQEYVCQFHWH